MSSLYIRVMTGFYTHRKTVRLRARIGMDALWLVPRLWAYCAENQPDGDLASYNAKELAMLLQYEGDAPSMLQAFKDCGFIDPDGRIHGWEEHNGYHQKFSERAKKAAIARWSKSPQTPLMEKENERGEKKCALDAPSIQQTASATVGKPDSPPVFLPVPPGTFPSVIREMIADAEKALKAVRANPKNYKRDLSDEAVEVIEFIRQGNLPDAQRRIDEVLKNERNYDRELKASAKLVVEAWKARIEELKRAKAGIVTP